MLRVLSVFVVVLSLFSCVPPDSPLVVTPSNGAKYVGYSGQPPLFKYHSELPVNIVISYPTPQAFVNVYLNGQPIGKKFSYGATQATAPFSGVVEFMRQGTNTLTINPEAFGPSITFIFDNEGPQVNIDEVVCLDGNCMDLNGGNVQVTVKALDPSNVTSVVLQSNIYLWDGGTDNTQYTPLKTGTVINGVSYPMTKNGDKFSVTIPESSMYTFVSTDENGYVYTNDYLSEGHKINSVFKMRIGQSLLNSMLPVIEPMVDNMHVHAPNAMADYGKTPPAGSVANDMIENLSLWWTSGAIFYGRTDMGASTGNESDCGYVDGTASLTSSNFSCSNIKTSKNNEKYCLPGDVNLNGTRPDAKEGRCTRIVMWRLKLDKINDMSLTLSDSVNGRLHLDMDLLDGSDADNLALETDMGIRHIKCDQRYPTQKYCTAKLFGVCINNDEGVSITATGTPTNTMSHSPKQYCSDDGAATAALGIVNLGNLKVTATAGSPGGIIDARVLDGTILLNIDSSSFKLNLSGLTIGSWLDGFLGFLSGLLDGLFVDIVASVVEQNMTSFMLGFDLITDAGSTMRMQSHAYQVFTNADNNPATPVEWYMYYSGFLSPYIPHPDVSSTLGTFFKRNDVLVPADNPSTPDDNFSIGISANVINQGLASIYRSGLMHFTVSNFKKDGTTKIHYGPDATDGEIGVQNGDTRVVLIPKSPATFEMKQGGSGAQATLRYQGAIMDIDLYENNAWKTIFHAKVNIKAGVLMVEEDKKFHMTVDGTPRLEILELMDMNLSAGGTKNGTTGNVTLFISKMFLESAIALIIDYAIPQVAETSLTIDVPDIDGPFGTKVITTTESINANNGEHLGFSMGLNLE